MFLRSCWLALAIAGASVALADDETPHVGGVRITGSLVRIIDPATMRIYSERLQRTLHMPLQVPGRGAVASMVRERREYGYTYY